MSSCVVCMEDGPFPQMEGHTCANDAVMCNACWIQNANTNKSRLTHCLSCNESLTPMTILKWIGTITDNFTNEVASQLCQWFVLHHLPQSNMTDESDTQIWTLLHKLPFGMEMTLHKLNDDKDTDLVVKCVACRNVLGIRDANIAEDEDARIVCNHEIGFVECEGQQVPKLCNAYTCMRCGLGHSTEKCVVADAELDEEDMLGLQLLFFLWLLYTLVLESGYPTRGVNMGLKKGGKPTFISWCPGCKMTVSGWTACAHHKCGQCKTHYCRRCHQIGRSASDCHYHTPPFDDYGRNVDASVPNTVPMTLGGPHGMMTKDNMSLEELMRMVFNVQPYLSNKWKRLNKFMTIASKVGEYNQFPSRLVTMCQEALEASDRFREQHREAHENIYRDNNTTSKKEIWSQLVSDYEDEAMRLFPQPMQVNKRANNAQSESRPPAKRRRPFPPKDPFNANTWLFSWTQPSMAAPTSTNELPLQQVSEHLRPDENGPLQYQFICPAGAAHKLSTGNLYLFERHTHTDEHREVLRRAVRSKPRLSAEQFWTVLEPLLEHGYSELLMSLNHVRGKWTNCQNALRQRVCDENDVVAPYYYRFVLPYES